MFDPIETGRETQWFHTADLETDPAPTQYDTEEQAIEAAIERLAKHMHGGDRDPGELFSIDWQLYQRSVIHEVVETARGITTSVTITPPERSTTVRLTLIPPG